MANKQQVLGGRVGKSVPQAGAEGKELELQRITRILPECGWLAAGGWQNAGDSVTRMTC